MGRLNRIAASAVSLMLGIGSATTLQAESLADALVGAYNHSGLLQQNRALLRLADDEVAVQLSGLKPIINWSGSVTRNFSNNSVAPFFNRTSNGTTDATVALSLDLLLWDAGRTQFAIESAKESVLATRQGLISVEQAVLNRAVNAFLNVRRQIETVALRQNNLRLITEELRAAQDRFEVGEVTRTDVALAEARLAAARSGLAAAQGALVQAQEEYFAAVGRRPGNLTAPGALPRVPATVAEAKSVALRRHPDLRQAQHEVSAADLNIQVAQAAMKPTVSLGSGLSITERFNSEQSIRQGSVGLNVGGPIYQGGRLSALARQAQARSDASRGNLHLVRHVIQQNVGNAYSQLQVATASREASVSEVRAARQAFEGVREEAKLGARTTLEVLDAEQDLLDAQNRLISAIADQYIAAYTLLSTMGLLTADHLGLGVQQYDPVAYYNLVKDAPAVNTRQGRELDRVMRALGKN